MSDFSAIMVSLRPVAVGLGAIVVLLLIYASLKRTGARSIGPLYLAGTLVLGVELMFGEALRSFGGWSQNLLLSLLVLVWGYILFDLIDHVLVERALRRRGLRVPRLVRDILRGLVLVALLLVVVNRVFGVPLTSLVISSTVLSAVIGLALQDLLKDVIAGVAIQTEHPFDSGDWVQIGNETAQIVEMSWRATRMVTVDNTQVVVPNSTLAHAQIHNYSSISPLQALHVEIMLAPDHPPNQVKRVLTAAALCAEHVLHEPPPTVRMIAYGEYSVTYDVKFWMDGFARYIEVRDAVMTNLWYHIRRSGLRLPTPVRDVYLHEADAYHVSDAQRRLRSLVRERLAAIELFSVLSDAECAELAERTELCVFGIGEVLVRQGDRDDTLYVIHTGRVRVEVTPEPYTPAVKVAELGAGDFFGELAVLTGAPRRATVIAEDDCEVLVVRREAIGPLFERNTVLPERLSEALERRVAQTQRAISAAGNPPMAVSEDMSQPSLLQLIQRLFGLRDF